MYENAIKSKNLNIGKVCNERRASRLEKIQCARMALMVSIALHTLPTLFQV